MIAIVCAKVSFQKQTTYQRKSLAGFRVFVGCTGYHVTFRSGVRFSINESVYGDGFFKDLLRTEYTE